MANPIIDIFRVKELRERILFTLAVLCVFRFGVFLPIPGIDPGALKNYFQAGQGSGGVTDYLDFFAGGAFKNFSVFMLGVMPYISTQIIMQLLLVIFPSMKKLAEEDGGRKKINKYTRIASVFVAAFQSFTVTVWAQNIHVLAPGFEGLRFTFVAILTVTTGCMLLMWMGDQITKRGIGNGVSLLIFAGIVARLPNAMYEMVKRIQNRDLNPIFVIVVFGMFAAVVALVILEQRGQRKIPVHYAKRVVGRKMFGAQNTYIPFKINPSGVIPVIFASSLLTMPMQVAEAFGINNRFMSELAAALSPAGWLYMVLYTLLIVFFSYFYTQVTLNPQEISKNIRENGGSIPGIRSEKIEEYLTKILNRIMLPGSLYLAVIALMPSLIVQWFDFPQELAYLMGGTSLLILVGVDLDTMSQIEANLRMHHHDGLTKKGKIRGRNL